MKKLLFVFLCLCGFAFFTASAQITFQRTYGGSGSDEGRCVKQTWDGGYIIAGSTSSFGAGVTDVYLLKVDSFGNMQWQKTFGGNNIDRGYSLDITSDSGYVICGSTNSFGFGGYDAYLIRTDQNGDSIWTKTYGGIDWDFGYSVQQTNDDGFVIAGGTYSFGNGDEDVYVVKTSSTGDTLWTKAYGGSNAEVANDMQQTNDNGYIICGNTMSFGFGQNDIYLIKLDAVGNSVWVKTYGGINQEEGNSVKQTIDGGFIIAGYTNTFSTPGFDSFYLVKTDANGDSSWTLIEPASDDKRATSIVERYNGGYTFTGTTTGQGNQDALFWQTYSNGGWFNSGSAGGVDPDIGYSIQQTSDHGFIIVGSTNSFGDGVPNVYLIKNDSMGAHLPYNFVSDLSPIDYQISAYPNPFNTSCIITFQGVQNTNNISLILFNLLGVQVNIHPARLSEKTFRIDKENLANGVYFCKIINEEKILGIVKIIAQ